MKAVLLATLAAILIQPLVFAAWIAAPLLKADASIPADQLLQMLFAVVLFAGAFVLFLGLPIFLALRRAGKTSHRHFALAGFLAGAVPMAVVGMLLGCDACSSSGNWHGHAVQFQVDGHKTLHGWLSLLEGVVQFGIHGLMGALAFGAVWRRMSQSDADKQHGIS